MKNNFSALFLSILGILNFLNFNAYSADEIPLKIAVQKVIDSQDKIPTGKIDSTCNLCKDTADNGASEDLFCKDLFQSACLKEDGSSQFEGSYKQANNLLTQKFKDARNKAALAMGFKDFKDATISVLRKNGIEAPIDLTDSQLASLLQEANDDSRLAAPIKYPAVKKCEATPMTDVIEGGVINYKKSVELYKNIITTTRAEQAELAVNDIPNFLSTEFQKCNSIVGSPNFSVDGNEDFIKQCKQFPRIKEEAVNLYRIEDTEGYKEKALAFIKKTQLPLLKKNFIKDVKNNPDQADYYDYKFHLISNCSNLWISYNNASQKIVVDFASEISKSKVVVESMIGSYYSDIEKKRSTDTLNHAKEIIKNLLPRIISDKNKIEKIATGYDRLDLAWLDKPSAESYQYSSKTGLPTLKIADDSRDEIAQAFADPRLSYFTQINAYYTPIRYDDNKIAALDKVHIMPYFLQDSIGKINLLGVVAHEAGHKIGPLLSDLNGYYLQPEWKDLLECYKKPDSINLQSSQQDETIADYISSEVLTEIISKLPPTERRNAFKEGVHSFCVFNDNENSIFSTDTKEEHPESSIRINGIFGGNPRLQDAIGCHNKITNTRSCSLK
jgi:hypothetical protein